MSAGRSSIGRPSSRRPQANARLPSTTDIPRLRARRREARRRRRLARLDLGLGAFVALVLLIATPGLAITAVIALIMLALCVLSVVLERRKHGRESGGGVPRPRRREGATGDREDENADQRLQSP